MQAIILSNRQFLSTYYRMSLRVPGLSPAFTPGQFVMLRPCAVGDPFLPRAFSIMRAAPLAASRAGAGVGGRRSWVGAGAKQKRAGGAEIEIVYRALGRGTTLMAALGRGNTMDVLGPLGRGFRPAPGRAVFVAGGVGVPPIVALAERLARRKAPKPGRRMQLSSQSSVLSPRPLALIGGRTRDDVLGVPECRRARCAVQVATDDGSLGHHGLVTDLLEEWIARAGKGHGHGNGGGAPPTIYGCGPEGMLRAVHGIALRAGLPCQLCLEANMACGFGGCMGCAIPVKGEGMGAYKLCCKDGPVFEAEELRW